MKEQDNQIEKSNLPMGLKPENKLWLEMLVADESLEEAQEFLGEHGVEIGEDENPLTVCKKWFKEIRRGEQGKLQIRFTDKGPTMDINA